MKITSKMKIASKINTNSNVDMNSNAKNENFRELSWPFTFSGDQI